ncbi:Hypothetical predicted protein [Olea europaea subsp. europaea]|uniref:Uncharacterized protein n=1 Tax=Olea europaea subsp. europaea TaxID=158383 RepID=A0A8S0QY16_OLEEU|nr:Hypothetical predicted protein [Olea europaea subsp. europaea]
MELKVAEEKTWQRREFRVSRGRNHKAIVSNILNAIAQVNGGEAVCQTSENGSMKMKIRVKKEDLKHVVEVVRDGKGIPCQSTPSMSLEQRLNFMRRRHVLRATQAKVRSRDSWTPVLYSIPEEL